MIQKNTHFQGTQIIDGKALAQCLRQTLQEESRRLKVAGAPLHVHVLEVNRTPAWNLYLRIQKRAFGELGFGFTVHTLESEVGHVIEKEIQTLNEDPQCTGILLQLPLPAPFDKERLQCQISPTKDLEAVHPINRGQLLSGIPEVGPCTAMAVLALIRSTGVSVQGKQATIVSHSELIGKPVALLLLALHATVSVVHAFTPDLAPYVRQAEILVVGAGKAERQWEQYWQRKARGESPPLPDLSPLVPGNWIRPGAIVIDVATNCLPQELDAQGNPLLNSQGEVQMITVGDVDFPTASQRADFITPVPGGVGPMTVAMLLQNALVCARRCWNERR